MNAKKSQFVFAKSGDVLFVYNRIHACHHECHVHDSLQCITSTKRLKSVRSDLFVKTRRANIQTTHIQVQNYKNHVSYIY